MSDLKGLQHIGVPVTNLDASCKWYGEVLGLTPRFTGANEGEDLSRTLQVPEAKIRFAFFWIGNTYLELLEYERPTGRPFELRNSDVGAVHVCFEVDDIEAVYERLKQRDVPFSSEPITIPAGALGGAKFVYFRDPDNIQLELFELPPNLRQAG
jgi:catechol 2,3-dioxygenase-like lactoylglutathione lyase family enzyme